MLRTCLLVLLMLGPFCAAQAEDAAAVLDRFKSASGAEKWDTVQSVHAIGTLSSGGLSGAFAITVDVTTGRFVDAYKMGSVDGADGYDGTRAWQRDPGGEVAALDTPEAIRRARSQAWLDARAYWYPQRNAAAYAPVKTTKADGKSYQVVTATPNGGDAVSLWFASDTGLLARTVQKRGQDTATIRLEDYRDVDGIRLPFASVTDLTDAAGRTDARRRTEIHLERVALNRGVADTDFQVPKMAEATQIRNEEGVARIPFQLINNHIFVNAGINGMPVRLMVDTAGFNMLTPEAAKRLGIAGEGKLAAAGTGSERVDLAVARARVVSIGTAELRRPVFYIFDLGQLAAVEGTQVDGLIGYEMFRRFGVEIDYGNKQITLTYPDKFTPPSGTKPIAFELDDHVPIVSATLDGLPLRISIDTGSRSSLTLHSPFVRSNKLIEKYHAAPECVTAWGVGGAQRSQPARLGKLQLGDAVVSGIAGELYTGNKGSFADPDLGGNLGGGVLRRFTVAFDFTSNKMYLKPNAAYAQAEAFDRSGLWLLADGDALKVADVVKGSAAAQAGLLVDDRITAIGGEPVAKRQLTEWRQRLRELPVGSKVELQFQRGGKSQTGELLLADRIPARMP